MSKSELIRLFDNKSILINGMRPSSVEEAHLPITQLIFFYKSKDKITRYIDNDN